ncbi:MAG TPA: hypothetical protein VFZ23_08030 [Pyrinomonadaceae bacterium]
MSCCGKQNTEFGSRGRASQSRRPVAVSGVRTNYRYTVHFEYVGKTGLTVIGSATKKKYRFERPGSRVEIDPRDRPSLAKVPNLREVTTTHGI